MSKKSRKLPPTFFHEPRLDIYYRPEMALVEDPTGNFSRSPSKPRRFMEHLAHTPVQSFVDVRDFAPLDNDGFLTAHTPEYVEAFFAGRRPLAESNGLTWSPEFASSVRYTNGSLVAAVMGALADPARIALSPSSGFHHARPHGGSNFCTFSGQVIAAVRAYREREACGAWIDLDGHFGNSIEDSRAHVPELAKAIPRGCNLNPSGRGPDYLEDLGSGLEAIGRRVLAGEIHYIAFAHGADSHLDDDLGGQLDTYGWLAASRLVYEAVAGWSRQLGRPVPVVLALFGGYRKDAPESVLELHVADTAIALATLAGADVHYVPRVTRRGAPSWMDIEATIPAEVLEVVRARRVREAGFGAGPSCVGGMTVPYDPPAPLEEGLLFLEKWNSTMRIGSLWLDDGSTLFFQPHLGFRRYDPTPRAAPQPGVTVRTAP